MKHIILLLLFLSGFSTLALGSETIHRRAQLEATMAMNDAVVEQLAAKSTGSKQPQSLNSAIIDALDSLGYDAGPPRDSLDARAHNAIKTFQKDHNLPQSGRVSKRLVAAMANALAQKAQGKGGTQGSGAARAVASGTGFVINENGHVLTNNHVVDGCREMRTGQGEAASVLTTDKAVDLAVLKLPKSHSAVATFRDNNGARPAEDIVVLGFPLHGLLGSDPIVTTGTISSLKGIRDNRNQIQISAPVQPGNSGGPVLDASGNVVGIVVSSLVAFGKDPHDIPENVNFAISEATARSFLDAHKIGYKVGKSSERLAAPDVASRANGFTLLLECYK